MELTVTVIETVALCEGRVGAAYHAIKPCRNRAVRVEMVGSSPVLSCNLHANHSPSHGWRSRQLAAAEIPTGLVPAYVEGLRVRVDWLLDERKRVQRHLNETLELIRTLGGHWP